jgi:LDH2 family malate/lactate/ureidoglycolate dehydrogenase
LSSNQRVKENIEVIPHPQLEQLVTGIFTELGASIDDASTVAEKLVEADLMGLPSHGVLRVSQYVKDIQAGRIVPGAEIVVTDSSATNAMLDGQWNFGQVGGSQAANVAIEKALSTGAGCAVLRRCCHVGRLGAYVEMAARRNCVALACGGAAGEGHWVAPFGGRQGRLGTNPLAFGAPTESDPIVVDFATSSLPEGKVRFLRETGQMLPEMTLVNERGEYSTNPSDLYASDGTAAGAILPFGGPLGYKSYGISLMVQMLSCLLGAPAWAEGNEYTGSNNLFILALRIESFMSPDEFRRQAEEMAAYVTSSKPSVASTGVKLPGELEFEMMRERRRSGIPLPPEVWSTLKSLAAEHGV